MEIAMTRTMPWGPEGAAPPLSATALNLVAALLRRASDLLEKRAARLAEAARVEAQAAADELLAADAQIVEFHAVYRDAGAPEGALYINGKLVGTISGVTRL
jgi:acyl-CoA reductase-like NAD-dependent aldehyde dehydrogenase